MKLYYSEDLHPILTREGFVAKNSVLDRINGVFAYRYNNSRTRELLVERGSIAIVFSCYHQSSALYLTMLQLDVILCLFKSEPELGELFITNGKFLIDNLEQRLRELKRELYTFDRFRDDLRRKELLKKLSEDFYVMDHFAEVPMSVKP